MMDCAPLLISMSTFTLYVVATGKSLTSDIVFPTIAFFSLMRLPLGFLPNAMTALIEAKNSTSRVQAFLNEQEFDDSKLRVRCFKTKKNYLICEKKKIANCTSRARYYIQSQ